MRDKAICFGQSDRGPGIVGGKGRLCDRQMFLSWDLKGQVRTSQTRSREQVSRQGERMIGALRQERERIRKMASVTGAKGIRRRFAEETDVNWAGTCKIFRLIKGFGFYIECNGKPFKDFNQEYMVILFNVFKKSLSKEGGLRCAGFHKDWWELEAEIKKFIDL